MLLYCSRHSFISFRGTDQGDCGDRCSGKGYVRSLALFGVVEEAVEL